VDLKDRFELAAQLLWADIQRAGVIDRVIAGSFTDTTTQYLRSIAPRVTTMAPLGEVSEFVLMYILGLTDSWTPKCQHFQVPTNLVQDEADFIRKQNARGAVMEYWTINDEDEMRALLCAGADGIMTDKVVMGRRVFDEVFALHINTTSNF